MRRLQSRALVALILISEVKAVEIGKPSKTSISAAARRALAARDYDPTVRNPDWLAELFLGPTERKMLAGDQAIKDLERDYREAIKEQPPVLGMAHIRTRFTDERLQHAVSGGAAQVVILGAGYDSRAYRMRELLTGVRVFEVDYGPTQEYKKRRVREIFGCLPPNVTYVSIDFTREKLGEVLAKAGYRSDRMTFFIWEGVTQYIPEDARRLIRPVSARGVASTVEASAMMLAPAKPRCFARSTATSTASPFCGRVNSEPVPEFFAATHELCVGRLALATVRARIN